MIIESTLRPENAISRTTVNAGDHYIGTVKQGQTLRILDLEGNQAADTLFFSADDTDALALAKYRADRIANK